MADTAIAAIISILWFNHCLKHVICVWVPHHSRYDLYCDFRMVFCFPIWFIFGACYGMHTRECNDTLVKSDQWFRDCFPPRSVRHIPNENNCLGVGRRQWTRDSETSWWWDIEAICIVEAFNTNCRSGLTSQLENDHNVTSFTLKVKCTSLYFTSLS